MNNPDLNDILNKEIGDLVDLMKKAIQLIGKQYDLNSDQLSEIERDFIARLAFAAIKYGDQKEPEKEPEKSDGLPSDVINSLLYVKRMCEGHDCDDCPFGSSGGFCKLFETPNDWEV